MSRWTPKTGRRWGALYNWVRAQLRARGKQTFTWQMFLPTLRRQQAQSAVQTLSKAGEIVRVKPCRRGRGGYPATYRTV